MNNKDLERLRKVSMVMEKVWLAIAVISLIVVIYLYFQEGADKRTVLSYLIFPALAALMFGFRRSFRKRQEQKNSESPDDN